MNLTCGIHMWICNILTTHEYEVKPKKWWWKTHTPSNLDPKGDSNSKKNM